MTDLTRQRQVDYDKAALTDPNLTGQQAIKIGERSAALHRALKGMRGHEDEYYKAFANMIEAYWIVGSELGKIELRGPGGDQYSVGILMRELNLTSKKSLEYQSIAKLPRTEIEAYIKARREDEEAVTKKAILDLAEAYKTVKQKTGEKADAVQMAMSNLCLKAKELIDHLRIYTDTDAREGITGDFFKIRDLCKAIMDDLDRATM